MAEGIFIGLIFVVALGYLGRRVYLNFRTDKGCAKGCGCGEAELKNTSRERAV